MIKAGKLECPVPNCTKRFFLISNFSKHLQLEAEVEKDLFKWIKTVECIYCTQEIEYWNLRSHFQNNHRDVSNFEPKNILMQFPSLNIIIVKNGSKKESNFCYVISLFHP